jgi:hypothetical protein
VNIGNPDETTILEFATVINRRQESGGDDISHLRTVADPQRRRPDISPWDTDWEPK